MKLSYIIPVYNVEKYLRQCVDSILGQTMDEYEIILVDDGSPDNCPSICDEYEKSYPDIVKVIHKENGGLASARNAGLDIACGEYIFFVDSDDYLVADRVKELYNKAKEFDADVLNTTYTGASENGEFYNAPPLFEVDRIYTHEDMEKEICRLSSQNGVIFVWRNLYKKDFLDKNNIRFEESLKMIEDAPFNTLAFVKAERFVAADIRAYCYRHRSGSLQRRKYIKDYDLYLSEQTALKIKYYTENCTPRKEYYEDLAIHIVIDLLPQLVRNIYINRVKNAYTILKRIGKSEMMHMSFEYYDINNFRSKSLDWLMTWCLKYKLYFAAHLICKFILYK